MNLIKLESEHEIYNPVNGKLIYDFLNIDYRKHGNESFLAYWNNGYDGGITINDNEIAESFKKASKSWNEEELDEWQFVEQFLEDYENENWLAFSIYYPGGILDSQVIFVIDLQDNLTD